MKNIFPLKTSYVQLLVTLLVLVGGLLFYYSVYIPSQERDILVDRYKRMRRIQLNINKKNDAFLDLLKQYSKYVSPDELKNEIKPDTTVADTFQRVSIINDSLIFRDRSSANKVMTKISLVDFFTPVLDKSSFSGFVVMNKDEEIFTTIPGGIGFTLADNLIKINLKADSLQKRLVIIDAKEYIPFVQPLGIPGLKGLRLIGFVEKEFFLKQSRALSEETFSLFFIALCIILLLLPSIKLIVLGTNELLRYRDIFSSYITLILLVSCVFLIISRLNSNLGNNYLNSDCSDKDPKVILSNEITAALKKDVRNALKTLASFRAEEEYFFKEKSLRNADGYSIRSFQKNQDIINHIKLSFSPILNVFWIDNDGTEALRISSSGKYAPKADYKDRHYYKDIINSSAIFADSIAPDSFSFDAIISRTDNLFKPVVAIHSRLISTPVIAMSCRFPSVQDALLPEGFGFAIFKSDGEVIFHSDSTKNLNENFIASCKEETAISQAIKANQKRSAEEIYNNIPHNILIRPLEAIPGYYIAVFSNENYSDHSNYGALLICLLIVGIMILFYCIEVLLTLAGIYRRNILKGNVFDYNFLFPHHENKLRYISHGISFLLASLFFIAIFFVYKDITVTEITVPYTPSFIKLIYGMLLNMFFATMVPLLTNSKILEKLRNEFHSDNKIKAVFTKQHYKNLSTLRFIRNNKTLSFFIIALLFVAVSAFINHCISFFIIYSSGLILIYAYGARSAGKAWEFLNTFNRYPSTIHSYAFMLFMRMILVGGVSVMAIYISSYNYSQLLLGRFRLHSYSEKYVNLERSDKKIITASDYLKTSNDSTINSVYAYTDSTWIRGIETATLKKSNLRISDYQERENYFRNSILNFITYLHPGLSEITAYSRQVSDTAFSIYKFDTLDNSSSLVLKIDENKKTNNALRLLAGEPLSFKASMFTASQSGFLYVLLFLVLMTAIWWLIRFTCRRYFDFTHFNLPIEKRNNDIIQSKDIYYVFVQGIPGISKFSYTKDLIKNSPDPEIAEAEIFKIDLVKYLQNLDVANIYSAVENCFNSQKIIRPKSSVILVNHFEFDFEKTDSNIFKLILLEKLIALKALKVIVISTIDQNEFLRMQFDSGITLDEKEQNSILKLKFRWRSVLGTFVNIYQREIENPFTKRLEPFTITQDQETTDKEDLSIMIQEDLAYHYYHHIWTTLAREEKLILMSLSNDGILNFKNEYYVGMLFQKGLLIVDDDRPVIFDPAFSNYILTVADRKDAERLETELSKGQSSTNFRYPLIALALGLIWLILYSNPDRYSGLLPLVSAMTTGIAAILTLIRTFAPAGKK